jgi:hypothetical protein
MPEEIEVKESTGEAQPSTDSKKRRLPKLKFWHRRHGEAMGHTEAWNDWDFGLFWVVAILLFFLKTGLWLLVAWVVVWFIAKSWKD